MRISDWSSDVFSSDLAEIHRLLDAQSGLEIVEGEAVGLLLAGGAVAGLSLADGRRLHAPSVVLATGTFLGGKLFRGEETLTGGRISESAATAPGEIGRAPCRERVYVLG